MNYPLFFDTNSHKTYEMLCAENDNLQSYTLQLMSIEWFQKRNIILNRDNYTCHLCGAKCIDAYGIKTIKNDMILIPGYIKEITRLEKVHEPYSRRLLSEYEVPDFVCEAVSNPSFPHVHHQYYVFNKLAWEYPDDCLITVCHECHTKIHQESKVLVYADSSLETEMDYTPCFRCSGIGQFAEFKHIDNGICFRCHGARYEELIR